MTVDQTKDLIEIISHAKKRTLLKVYLQGNFKEVDFGSLECYGDESFKIFFCDDKDFREFKKKYSHLIERYRVEVSCKNSALPLSDLLKFNARIEHGALIRDQVDIGDGAVIMMGAVINIAAKIGKMTMIDMNAVVGGGAIIGEKCHIGAGAVIAGVIEPPSAIPTIIEDGVLVGANAVILEGIRVGRGSVVGAGAVVTKDVPPLTVVAGIPAKIIKKVDKRTLSKTETIDELRSL